MVGREGKSSYCVLIRSVDVFLTFLYALRSVVAVSSFLNPTPYPLLYI